MEINLLKKLPQTQRNTQERAKARDPEIIRIAKQFGQMYFDGPRAYGYGGYRYDGRWIPVAKDFVEHFELKAGDRILDVGCAKGFLVKDFLGLEIGLDPFGIDISQYAIMHCEPEVVGRLHQGLAHRLPFPDHSFDLVVAINTLHNYDRVGVKNALQECMRVGKKKFFVQVDSYYTPEEKKIFEDWVLTAEFHDYPEGWRQLFQEVNYTGDYGWTLVR